jgi:hypothetical protein
MTLSTTTAPIFPAASYAVVGGSQSLVLDAALQCHEIQFERILNCQNLMIVLTPLLIVFLSLVMALFETLKSFNTIFVGSKRLEGWPGRSE